MKQKVLALVGGALLVIGLFVPVATLPAIGGVNLFSGGTNEIALGLLLLAIFAGALAGTGRLRPLRWVGGAAVAILLYVFVRVQVSLSQFRSAMMEDAGALPYPLPGRAALNTFQLQGGWLLLAAGAGALVYAGVSGGRVKVTAAPDDPEDAAADPPSSNPGDALSTAAAALSVVVAVAAVGWHLWSDTAPSRVTADNLVSDISNRGTRTTEAAVDGRGTGSMGGIGNMSSAGPDTASDREEADYISQHLQVYDLNARYFDSVLDGRVPGVRFKIRNSGNRTLNRVTVRIVFQDAGGNAIAEEEYSPVLVSQYSYGRSNTPLRPNYIWTQEANSFFKADNVPSEWATGKATATITEIDFAPGG